MLDPSLARIFISYSRKDGAAFAAALRERLVKENLSVWQDIIALEGGRDWWSQIEDALRSKALQHFVLVVTPGALDSKVVRDEIRLARQGGKTVSPVGGPGLKGLNKLPRWLGQIYDLDVSEQRTLLIRVLQGPSTQKRVAMMAPEPPVDYVQRPVEFDALKQQLLDAKGDSVAITAALRGAGGYGKTTLAMALAHDPDVEEAYFDGILWVELGESPGNLLSLISDLVEILSGERPGIESVNAAAAKLGEALGDRRILMIVDDAWRGQDLRPFLHGGPNTTRLITTRLNRVLPAQVFRQSVDAMTGHQARELLSSGLPQDQVRPQSTELGTLAGRLGGWAQVLRLVNGFLRERVIDGGEPLRQAIADADDRLTEEGLVAFDANHEDDRTKAVARTINLSLGLLDEKQRARFGELAIFPEDADIPIGVVARLWQETAGLSEGTVRDLLVKFYTLSLLLGLDLNQRTFRFHDTIRGFLQNQIEPGGLCAQHKRLVGALEEIGTSDRVDAVTRRYYYLHLPYHLAEADERERLGALLTDPSWLTAKLAATANPQTLVADYEQHAVGETQSLIGRTVRLTSGICARDQRQLIPQLLARLMRGHGSAMAAFLDAARRQVARPALLAARPSLTLPGAETARLEGHAHWVNALCLLPDGRLASGSSDNTIRLWDVKTGAETARLEGHSGGVGVLCVLPDGRLASGSSAVSDSAIRLWDVKTGAETARLKGHLRGTNALCVLADGRLASGSSDRTIRLWDVKTGSETARLKGCSGGVNALCVLPDGRLASGADDNRIHLWDLQTGAKTGSLEGHLDSISTLWGGGVNALCVLPDGRLASGSSDNTIRLWDVKTGAETACLEGHASRVNALCLLPDGRLASGSSDKTIRVWNVKTSAESARLEGHFDWLSALCLLPDGRLASGSGDDTIRLWDVITDAESTCPEGHSDSVSALCTLADGRLASGSRDSTIRLLDVTTGAEITRLEGHSRGVSALCLLPDGRLASGSWDGTIKLWDVMTGAETARLEGHSDGVRALCSLPDGRLAASGDPSSFTIRLWELTTSAESFLEGHHGTVTAMCVLPDGRLASGSADNTIRLWNVKTGAESARLKGEHYWESVNALCVLADGRLASGSSAHPIRLWDVTTGAETGRLEGHSGGVQALCLLPDGRLASGAYDNTIRLWDIEAGCEIAHLEVDAPVRCLAPLPDRRLVASDQLGRLHWLDIVD
jgi:WD40 repeat protein